MPKKRQDAINACRTLNYFIGDLVAASRARQLLRSLADANNTGPDTVGSIERFALGYLFLTLCKWTEFYDRFLHVTPDDCRAKCKSLTREIRRRKIPEFRNTFIGHIWDKKRGRPLTGAEIEAAAEVIVEGDADGFCAWCNNHEDNKYPNTVASIVEHVRDRLIEEFSLTAAELEESLTS